MPILTVPYISQWQQTASRYRTDCGVACVASLLAYYGKLGDWTVDQLAAQTPLTRGDVGLPPEALVALGAKHGLALRVNAGTTLAQIKAEIDSGRPVIALIAYRFVLGRLDQGDNVPGRDLHFIVLVGYDDRNFVADDPDYWAPYTERGHNALIPITQIEQAIAGAGYFRKCVFSEEDPMTTQVEIDTLKTALTTANAALAAAWAVANTLVPDAPPLPPPVVTPVTKYVNVAVDQVAINARKGPSVSTDVMGKIPRGTAVVVTPSADPQWVRIADGDYKDGYLFVALLSDTRP